MIYRRWRNAKNGGTVFPGKNTPMGDSIPNGQPWKHTHDSIIQTGQVIFRTRSARIIHRCTQQRWKQRPWLWKRKRRGIWEGLMGGTGKRKGCNCTIISKGKQEKKNYTEVSRHHSKMAVTKTQMRTSWGGCWERKLLYSGMSTRLATGKVCLEVAEKTKSGITV